MMRSSSARSSGSCPIACANHNGIRFGAHVGGKLLERAKELHLRWKILAAIRHVHGHDRHSRKPHEDDAVFVVEGGVFDGGPLRRDSLADVKTDA